MKKDSILHNVLPVLVAIYILFIISGCGKDEPVLYQVSPGEIVSVSSDSISEDAIPYDISTIYVHISGAVHSPGVYQLNTGCRLYDAISLAGGFTDDASQDYCNLAAVLEDANQYYIPTVSEAIQLKTQELDAQSESKSHYDSDGRLNINMATKEELMALSGIGESRAVAIITYRDEHGGFVSPEDIKNVSGIKDALYSQIADYITVI